MDMIFSSVPFMLVGSITILLLTIILLKYSRNYRSHLPPGPRAIPVIGHLHLIKDKNRPTHQILNSLSSIYGPIMHLKYGSRPVLVINSSDLAKECFTVNDRAFASRPLFAHSKHLAYNYSMLGWAPYGPYWRNARKICVLELLSSKRIQSFRPKRMKEISKAVSSLFEQSQSQSIVNMRNVFAQLSFNILLSMIVDEKYFGEESGVSVELITRLIKETSVLKGVICIGDYIPWLKWLDLQRYEKAMKKVQGKLDLYMQRILEKHREKGSKEERVIEDFIDVLISQAEENAEAISDKDVFIKATALVMINAGTDTSSVALEWALSMLLQHPHAMEKAQAELDSIIGRDRLVEEADIPQLPYLQAIVKETLRLHPSAPLLLPHKSIQDCTVGGYHIPAGTTLLVNAWAIHRDPKTWTKPLEFMPERFMEKGVQIASVQMKENEFEMFPFGAGRRSCPGASLAMCTVQTTLARLLQSFDWFVPDSRATHINEGISFTLPRAMPLEVTINPRLSHHSYQQEV